MHPVLCDFDIDKKIERVKNNQPYKIELPAGRPYDKPQERQKVSLHNPCLLIIHLRVCFSWWFNQTSNLMQLSVTWKERFQPLDTPWSTTVRGSPPWNWLTVKFGNMPSSQTDRPSKIWKSKNSRWYPQRNLNLSWLRKWTKLSPETEWKPAKQLSEIQVSHVLPTQLESSITCTKTWQMTKQPVKRTTGTRFMHFWARNPCRTKTWLLRSSEVTGSRTST